MQKILIVDDKEQNLFTLEKVLADLEVDFIRAENGNDALKATLHNDFALAILDVQMPEMDGYELAELLRYDPRTENLPVIFLSAVYHDDYHVFKGYESGAVDFIIKPYAPKILISKVQFFLQLHRQKEALRHAVKLEKAKNYLENILFSMTDAVLVVNPDGCIETCNQGRFSLIDFERNEIVGKQLNILLDEEEYTSWVQALPSEIVPGGTPDTLRNRDGTLLTKGHGKIPVLLSASPIHDNSGRLHGAVFLAKDMREQKKLQEQIHQAKRMKSIGLMASGVAHDLNNILAGVIGYPELLLYNLPDNSSLRQPIEGILESGQRAAAVVSDLLTIAKGAASAKKVGDLNALILEGLNSPECKKLQSLHPNTTCQHHLEATRPNILCSQIHIKKCLINLLNNAIQAIDGEGTVTLSSYNQYINEATGEQQNTKAGEYAVLSVRDTGSGISAADLEQIFEPFYTRKKMGRGGTGLGLTVVWNTIKDHGGKIFTESNEQGTCFQLYFPVNKEKYNEESGKPTSKINQVSVLIVDDESYLRDISVRMLRSLGYMAASVSSGELAIKYIQKNPVDLIVIDMVMKSGMNGQQTYEELIKLYPNQKVLFASSFANQAEVEGDLKPGAGVFIKKPYSIEQLDDAVQEALSG